MAPFPPRSPPTRARGRQPRTRPPHARRDAAATEEFRRPIVFGGVTDPNGGGTVSVESYYPALDIWNAHPATWLPEPIDHARAAILRYGIEDQYVVLGTNASYRLEGGIAGEWKEIQAVPGTNRGAYGSGDRFYLPPLRRFKPAELMYLHRKP